MRIPIVLSVLAVLLLTTSEIRAQNDVVDAIKEHLVPIDSNKQDGYSMNMDLFTKALQQVQP